MTIKKLMTLEVDNAYVSDHYGITTIDNCDYS